MCAGVTGQLRRVSPEPVVGVGSGAGRGVARVVVVFGTLTNRHPCDTTEGARGVGVAARRFFDIYDTDVLQSPMEFNDDWIGLTEEPLPYAEVAQWAVQPDCGGVVTFAGTVRDSSDGRPGVTTLEYEAYRDKVEPRLATLASEARRRWPDLGRLALLHRLGKMGVGEASVVVAASAPHRQEAFEAARWCIDALKQSVPIWKRETWSTGSDWALGAREIAEVGSADG